VQHVAFVNSKEKGKRMMKVKEHPTIPVIDWRKGVSHEKINADIDCIVRFDSASYGPSKYA